MSTVHRSRVHPVWPPIPLLPLIRCDPFSSSCLVLPTTGLVPAASLGWWVRVEVDWGGGLFCDDFHRFPFTTHAEGNTVLLGLKGEGSGIILMLFEKCVIVVYVHGLSKSGISSVSSYYSASFSRDSLPSFLPLV